MEASIRGGASILGRRLRRLRGRLARWYAGIRSGFVLTQIRHLDGNRGRLWARAATAAWGNALRMIGQGFRSADIHPDGVRERERRHVLPRKHLFEWTLARCDDDDPRVVGDRHVDGARKRDATIPLVVHDVERLDRLTVHDDVDTVQLDPIRGANRNVERERAGRGLRGVAWTSVRG